MKCVIPLTSVLLFCTDRNYKVLEKNKAEVVALHAARATGGTEV